jgi:hypothetical protein
MLLTPEETNQSRSAAQPAFPNPIKDEKFVTASLTLNNNHEEITAAGMDHPFHSNPAF